MPQALRIALLIESSRAYGRGLLRGIARYARTHGRWSIRHHERALRDGVPHWLASWRPDGVIARVESRRHGDQLRELGVPVVDLRGRYKLPGIPLIETDDRVVMRLAVTHLRERGFAHYAYCGLTGANYSERRLQFLRELATEMGFEPRVFEGPPPLRTGDTQQIEDRGLRDQAEIADWLGGLPRPLGLIACNDIRGQQVLSACRDAGVAVPDDVAVVGVDNDRIICELADPPLTSVEPDTERIGYEAAALLERMIAGEPPPGKVFVAPLRVVARTSTDALAVADRDIAAAVRYIRLHAGHGICVDDVVQQVPLSRSTLERRFRRLIGHSPKAEISRVRLDQVKRLLAETDYPLAQVAERAGYPHPEYMCTQFRRLTGQTPGAYRRAVQRADSSDV